MKSYIAEALGTCLLTLALILGASLGPWVGAILAAFVLMFITYSCSHVSGAHVNPAITIGALFANKITPKRAFNYIISQFAGASLAIAILYYSKIASPTQSDMAWSWKLFTAEAVGMSIFAYGFAAVAFKKVDAAASGFVVGLSAFLGLIVAMLMIGDSGSSAILNPAVAFGLSATSVASVLGPIVGSIIGVLIFVILSENFRQIASEVKRNFNA